MFKRLLLLVTCLVAFSGHATLAEKGPSTDDFNKAYKKFQQNAQKGNWRSAIPHAKKSFEIGKAVFGTDSKNTAALAHNYGVTLLKVRQRDKAKAVLVEAIELHENVYGKEAAQLVPVLFDFADSMNRAKDRDEKLKALDRALLLTEKAYGKDSANWAQRSVDVGVKKLNGKTLKESRALIKQGHDVLAEKLGDASPRVHYAALQLGKVELAMQNNKVAVGYLEKALAGATTGESPSKSMELAAREFLIQGLERLGQREAATEHLLALGIERSKGQGLASHELVKRAPKFPSVALERKKGGHVIVKYDIDKEGYAVNAEVVERKGHLQLEKASLEAVEQFRYIPYFKNGKPIVKKGIKNKFSFDIGKKKVFDDGDE